MILSFITDDVALASAAERAGIDRIMIDLEREGKAKRQAGRNLFQSTHQLESVRVIRASLERAALMVRINPLSERTADEIDAVVAAGADVIMLPYFFTPDDVHSFVTMVGGRSRISLLVETLAAAGRLDECLASGRIDEVHIGLNDLSIELGSDVMLEPICTGMTDGLAAVLRDAGVPFGVGGIGRLSSENLPVRPERMLAEQVRLGCTRGWLGRTFREGLLARQLTPEIDRIREAITRWAAAPQAAQRRNHQELLDEIRTWKENLALARERDRVVDPCGRSASLTG